MEHIYLVNNKQQEYETYREHTGETRDNVGVKVKEVLITYQIVAERSVWICENVSDYGDRIKTEEEISSALKNAISELTAEDVKNRAKLEPRVLMKISESLACKYGADTVKVSQVLIGIVEMEEGYTEALRLKSQALQEQARVEIENQTALSKAETDRKVALLEAETEAERVRILAKAESEANEALADSVNGKLIELRKIEKWDGRLPSVMSGIFGDAKK